MGEPRRASGSVDAVLQFMCERWVVLDDEDEGQFIHHRDPTQFAVWRSPSKLLPSRMRVGGREGGSRVSCSNSHTSRPLTAWRRRCSRRRGVREASSAAEQDFQERAELGESASGAAGADSETSLRGGSLGPPRRPWRGIDTDERGSPGVLATARGRAAATSRGRPGSFRVDRVHRLIRVEFEGPAHLRIGEIQRDPKQDPRRRTIATSNGIIAGPRPRTTDPATLAASACSACGPPITSALVSQADVGSGIILAG
jgi:hypothetical protein